MIDDDFNIDFKGLKGSLCKGLDHKRCSNLLNKIDIISLINFYKLYNEKYYYNKQLEQPDLNDIDNDMYLIKLKVNNKLFKEINDNFNTAISENINALTICCNKENNKDDCCSKFNSDMNELYQLLLKKLNKLF